MTDQDQDTPKPKRRAISPRSGAELPVPGPGRPKGSKDKPNSPRAIKYRWINEYRALCRSTNADGYENPLVWAYAVAKRMAEQGDHELLKRLATFIFERRFPSAIDPDFADLSVRLAEVEAEGTKAAQEEGKGSQQINVILGELSNYAKAVMIPPVEAEVTDVPAQQQEIGAPKEQETPQLGMASVDQPGTWEE